MDEKRQLVVKDNVLIGAAYTLDLSEQRLLLMAIVGARQAGLGVVVDQPLLMHAADYAKQFGISRDTAYEALQQAAAGLFDRYFSYQQMTKKGNVEHVKSRWVSQISYVEKEGTVSITFAPAVVPLITRLEQHFTSYELEQVSSLTSTYAIRLYELLIGWRSVGKTPQIPMEEFREKLGVEEGSMARIDNFKRKVLDIAIKQVNEHTDITASYEQHKRGRIVSGFSFTFKIKPPPAPARDPNTVDMLNNQTDAEGRPKRRKKITRKEAEAMANPGESWADVFTRLGRDYLIV